MLVGRMRIDPSSVDKASRERLHAMLRELDRACSGWHWINQNARYGSKERIQWENHDALRRRVRHRLKSVNAILQAKKNEFRELPEGLGLVVNEYGPNLWRVARIHGPLMGGFTNITYKADGRTREEAILNYYKAMGVDGTP